MRRKILIITKHLRVGGTEKMLLRILKQWLSLNYEIDIVLLYNSVTLRDDVLKRCHITSIFPEKSPQAKQLVKSDPGSIYRSKIHKLYDIEIAFQEGLPTKLVANSPNRLSYKIAWVHTNFLQYHFSASAYNSLEEEAKRDYLLAQCNIQYLTVGYHIAQLLQQYQYSNAKVKWLESEMKISQLNYQYASGEITEEEKRKKIGEELLRQIEIEEEFNSLPHYHQKKEN